MTTVWTASPRGVIEDGLCNELQSSNIANKGSMKNISLQTVWPGASRPGYELPVNEIKLSGITVPLFRLLESGQLLRGSWRMTSPEITCKPLCASWKELTLSTWLFWQFAFSPHSYLHCIKPFRFNSSGCLALLWHFGIKFYSAK